MSDPHPASPGAPPGEYGPRAPGQARLRRPGAAQAPLGDRLLSAYTWLIIIWLALPIAVMIVFGFNNPHGRYNFTWVGLHPQVVGPAAGRVPRR